MVLSRQRNYVDTNGELLMVCPDQEGWLRLLNVWERGKHEASEEFCRQNAGITRQERNIISVYINNIFSIKN